MSREVWQGPCRALGLLGPSFSKSLEVEATIYSVAQKIESVPVSGGSTSCLCGVGGSEAWSGTECGRGAHGRGKRRSYIVG